MAIVQSDTSGDRNAARPASFIAAFDLADGTERWRTPRNEDNRSSFGTPTIYEGVNRPAQIVTNGGERARAYDPMTGKEIWSLAAPSDIVTPSPVVGADLIYIMSGNTGVQPIFAIRSNAIGDITLKPGEDSSDFVAWSSTPWRRVHPHAASVRRPPLLNQLQRHRRLLRCQDGRAQVPGPPRASGGRLQQLTRLPPTGASTSRARTAKYSSSEPDRRSSFSPRIRWEKSSWPRPPSRTGRSSSGPCTIWWQSVIKSQEFDCKIRTTKTAELAELGRSANIKAQRPLRSLR